MEEFDRPGRAGGLVGAARSRLGLAPARAVRFGAVGLAALALLSSATYATTSQIAVPAERTATSVPAPDLSQRSDRTNRDAVRPTPAPTSSASSASSAKPSSAPAKPSSAPKDPAAAMKPDATKASTKPSPAEPSTAKRSAAPSPAPTRSAEPSPAPTRSAEPSAAPTSTRQTELTSDENPTAVGTRYTRVDLNVRAEPAEGGRLITVLDSGSKISIAGQVSGEWQSVVYSGSLRWVKKQYLVTSKPSAEPSVSSSSSPTSGSSSSSPSGSSSSSSGVSSGACAGGSSVESGLTADAIAVHRAVCARFPQITSFGGVRPDSLPEHPSGRALDCMLPNYSSSSGNALGWEIANWLKGNAGQLGISQILFDQKIWTVQRGGEGWRSMSSRGSATADHRDHVHVSVYGNGG